MLFAQHEPAGLDALMRVVFYFFVTFWAALLFGCCVIPSLSIKGFMQFFLLKKFRLKLTRRQAVMFCALLFYMLVAPWIACAVSDVRATVGGSPMPRVMAQIFIVDGLLFFGIWLLAVNSRGFLSWLQNLVLTLFFATCLVGAEMLIFAMIPGGRTV